MPPNIVSRYERKFVGNLLFLEKINNWIINSPLGFQKHHPDRYVNSLYFDTDHLDLYWDHVGNRPERCKVRYRWYGDTSSPNASQLEIKYKKNRVGWKTYSEVSEDFLHSGTKGDLHVQPEWNDTSHISVIKNLFPTIITKYLRTYLISFDGLLRVTIDQEQKYFGQREFSGLNLTQSIYNFNVYVVEFKYETINHAQILPELSTIPTNPCKYSKYTTGIQKLYYLTDL